MELKVKVEDLQKTKLFVATPMYGGQCAGIFTKSTNELSMFAAQRGFPLVFHYLFNESLITRARNYCVDEFLRSDCTHMMFIDSDIGFHPNDVYALVALSLEHPDKYDVICGPYPKKSISWEKIIAAYNAGYGQKSPFELENFVGDYVFNPVPREGKSEFAINEPVEVLEAGTGFMLIPRATFEKYDEAYPELKYRPDHIRTKNFDGTREIMAYFDCIFDRPDEAKVLRELLDKVNDNASDPVATKAMIADTLAKLEKDTSAASNRYLSEDYMFCQNVRRAGMSVWLCPWMELKHMGSYMFGGSIAALAAIQASPTADKTSNEKHWQNQQSIPKNTPVQVQRPKRVKRKKKARGRR